MSASRVTVSDSGEEWAALRHDQVPGAVRFPGRIQGLAPWILGSRPTHRCLPSPVRLWNTAPHNGHTSGTTVSPTRFGVAVASAEKVID